MLRGHCQTTTCPAILSGMKKAHFIGICGKGMSATAKLLKDLGWSITGSDSNVFPPISDYLKNHQIPCSEGYKPENIPDDADLIVIGKNAKLVPEENAEVRAAFESGKPIRSFPEVLEGLLDETRNIVVAGSYGKSTCTALLSWCLLQSGKDPSFFIGDVVRGLSDTSRIGASATFVLEGDEYPSANWDSTSKFLYFKPHDVLLTSAEHDHVNVFPTHTEYLAPFKTLLSLIPHEGLLVACADDPSALALAHTHPGAKILYGLKHPESEWSASDIAYGKETVFNVSRNGEPIVSLTTTLLGKHNIQNIVGVSALLLAKQLLTPEELSSAVKSFQGVRRRLELLTPASSVSVYEGYGTSYQKAKAAFEAIELHFPDRRLITVFEPDTFSWRNRDTIHWYDDVFSTSDVVLMYKPHTQGAGTHKQLTQEEIVERVEASGVDVHSIASAEEALIFLKQELKPGDIVLMLTSGSIGGLTTAIPKLADLHFPIHAHEAV